MRTSLWVVLALAGCATEGEVGDGVTAVIELAPPPVILSIGPTFQNTDVQFSVSGANPNEEVLFLFSQTPGTTCPPSIAPNCLGLDSPQIMGRVTADSQGNASFLEFLSPQFPVGANGYFQAVSQGSTPYVSQLEVRTVLAQGGGTGTLVLTDSATGLIYIMDEAGMVQGTVPSPVGQPVGLAWDELLQDGYWVVGLADNDTAYKVNAQGSLISQFDFGTTSVGPLRGADYSLEGGVGLLAVIGTNINQIDVIWGYDTSTGARNIETSHYSGGFLMGYWGVHVESRPSDFYRWSTWPSGDIEYWEGSVSRVQTIGLGLTGMKGITRNSAGEFFVVDDDTDRVLHYDASGVQIGAFPTPGGSPAGIDWYP